MAYKIVVSNHMPAAGGKYVEIILDSDSDVSGLSTDYAPGSIAIVADKGGKTYMLNASHEWKEL